MTGQASPSPQSLPVRVLSRAEHPISRSLLSENALKVLYRLHRAGFLAYLVGGAVRDLLLGRKPKDFDVGTNARPQQVRQLFRNSRIVGRRFPIARVQFLGEVVEVATFRRSPGVEEPDGEEITDPLSPELGREEDFGTPQEDAFRRDFTVNGLFYNIADFTVIDYVGGLEDLQRKVIRVIGTPSERFQEDPVRMMRALEYAVRLGFSLDRETEEAIYSCYREIRRASPARLAYELCESLKGGHASGIFRAFWRLGLLAEVCPFLLEYEEEKLERFFHLLHQADMLFGKLSLSEEALLALLVFPPLEPQLHAAATGGLSLGLLEAEIKSRVGAMAQLLAFSHYRSHLVRYGLMYFARLRQKPRSPKQALRFLRHEAFPVALQLLAILAVADPSAEQALSFWRGVQKRVEAGQPPLLQGGGRLWRRRRKARSPSP